MEDFSQYLKLINNCDPDDPLISSTNLGKRLANIPIHLVDQSKLSMLQTLNMRQLVPTENGLARDYRGLAELMGFSSVEIETRFKRSYNPVRSLLDAFINRDLNIRSSAVPPCLNTLLKMLEKIERFDVIDDLLPNLIELAQTFLPRKLDKPNLYMIEPKLQNESDNFDKLTIDDASRNSAIMYDAFICFAPDDYRYADELITFLEERNKRVAIAEDLLPGRFEHDALMRLIDSRCRKIIIILTPNFLQSRECEFRSKFASELGIRSGSHNIIPVIFESCDDSMLPSMIKVLSKIDMTNRNYRRWQLNKLICSLDVEIRDELDSNLNKNGAHDIHSSMNIHKHHFNQQTARSDSPRLTGEGFVSGEPVIELMHSQTSSINADMMVPGRSKISLTPTPPPSSTLVLTSISPRSSNWFKNVKECTKRFVNGISSTAETNSHNSQAKLLLTSSSSDLTDETTQNTSSED